ncbi:DUF2878 family protein, partial [Veronia pacifica]
MRVIALSLLFNVYWVIAVVGQQDYWPLLAVLLAGSLVFDRKLLWVVPSFAIIGILGDSALMFSGVFEFPDNILPIWLMFLWAGFAAYVWLVKDWILDKPKWLLLVAGAVGGS